MQMARDVIYEVRCPLIFSARAENKNQNQRDKLVTAYGQTIQHFAEARGVVCNQSLSLGVGQIPRVAEVVLTRF